MKLILLLICLFLSMELVTTSVSTISRIAISEEDGMRYRH